VRKVISMIVIALGSLLIFECGGTSSSTPTTPAELPIAIEALDGETGIKTNSTFTYTFSSAIDTATLTATSFYLAEGTSCDVDNPIATTISCDAAALVCTLTPDSELIAGVTYTLCITTAVLYESGEAVFDETQSFTFTTLESDETITVSPATVTLAKGATQQFSAVDGDGNDVTSSVTWSTIVGTDGGTFSSGTPGLYSLPSIMPPNNEVTVTAVDGNVRGTSVATLTIGSTISFTEKNAPSVPNLVLASDLAHDDENATIYIGWIDSPADFSSLTPYLSKSDDGGGTFTNTDISELTDTGGFITSMYYNDGFFLFGEQTLTEITSVSYMGSTDYGVSFSSPAGVSLSGQSGYDNLAGIPIAGEGDDIYSTQIVRRDGAAEANAAYLLKSVNYGSTFSSLGVIDTHEGDGQPKCMSIPNMVMDSDGTVMIVYAMADAGECEASTGDANAFLKTYDSTDGISAAAVNISASLDNVSHNPDIAIDSSDTLHVIWSHTPLDEGENALTIYYSRSIDGGASFSTPVSIANAGSFDFNGVDDYKAKIAVDSFDNINVVYFIGGDSTLDIALVRSINGGSTWSSPIQINSTSGVVYPSSGPIPVPAITTDSAGRVYVTSPFGETTAFDEIFFAIGE